MSADNKNKITEKEIQYIKSEAEKNKDSVNKYLEILTEWLKYEDAEYIGCEINKDDVLLMQIYHNDTIYLVGTPYPTWIRVPKIMFKPEGDNIYIEDVLMVHNDVGNGSIAMRALIKWAQSHNYKMIYGYMSSVDDNHKNRRNHYYQKFSFKLIGDYAILNLKGE